MFSQPFRLKIVACVASVSVFFSPCEAFFAFWRRKNWGERNTDGRSFFALAPVSARSKSEKWFKPAESLTETLASQARKLRLRSSITSLRRQPRLSYYHRLQLLQPSSRPDLCLFQFFQIFRFDILLKGHKRSAHRVRTQSQSSMKLAIMQIFVVFPNMVLFYNIFVSRLWNILQCLQ